MKNDYEPPSSDEFDEMVYVSICENSEPKIYTAGKGYYYTGCFLDQDSATEMKRHRPGTPLAEPGEDLHMTILVSPKNVDERLFGEQIKLKVIGYGLNKDNEGFLVEAFSDNETLQRLIDSREVPHVTMSISEHGKHRNTRCLQFSDIEPFEVIGTYGGCVRKEDDSRQIILHFRRCSV